MATLHAPTDSIEHLGDTPVVPSVPVYVYMTVCCINDWHDILTNIEEKIRSSGLYDIVTGIRCSVSSRNPDPASTHPLLSDSKTTIVHSTTHNHGNTFEKTCLDILRDECQQDPDERYILYVHTKGVSARHQKTDRRACIRCWTDYMLYFLVEQHELAMARLPDYDAVGVNLNGAPHAPYSAKFRNIADLIEQHGWAGKYWPYHYSGNFWWSKGSYIRHLTPCEPFYPGAEIWIMSGNRGTRGRFLSLWNAHTRLYKVPYSRDRYADAGTKEYERVNVPET
jgi:hypothetical protein